MPSVEGNQYFLDGPQCLKSLEDLSAEIVKETLVKALSGDVDEDHDTCVETQPLFDSPSRLILVQSEEHLDNTGSLNLIDTPSKMNLAQINECYDKTNEINVNNDQPKESSQVDGHENTIEPVLTTEEANGPPAEMNTPENANSDLEQQTMTEGDEEETPDQTDHNMNQEETKCEEKKEKADEEPSSKIIPAKELYSSSSTHLCTKLTETLQNRDFNTTAHQRSTKSFDLSKHDLRTSVRYLKSFSGYYLIPLSLSYRNFVTSFNNS